MPSMHVGGMASGMDVQATIDQILSVEAKRVTKVQDTQTELTEDIAAWSSVSASMTSLSDSLYDLASWSVWNQMNADASDGTKLTATATSSAAEGTYDITITRLAKSHSIASDSATDLGLADAESVLVGTVAGIAEGDTFTVGGETITIEADDTISSLRTKINDAAENMADDERVSASIIDDRLVLTRTSTGATDISLADSLNTPLEALGILSAPATVKNELVASQDAEFSVNGVDVVRSANTGLTDVIENVTLNLADEAGAGLTLTISRDKAAVKTAIMDFISSYNDATANIKSLTEVDLSDPTNPQVGELQGDSMANEILYNLRRLATDQKTPYMDDATYTYDSQTGVANSLADIGVWTSGTSNELEVVDESRLDYMLDNYFDEVEQIMRGVADGGSGYEHGVAGDLHDYTNSMSESMTGQIAKRIFTLNDKISDAGTKIEEMLASIDRYEQSLWLQFSAMEDAIAKMQQSMSFLGALGGGG